jgi:hypothetical protein
MLPYTKTAFDVTGRSHRQMNSAHCAMTPHIKAGMAILFMLTLIIFHEISP